MTKLTMADPGDPMTLRAQEGHLHSLSRSGQQRPAGTEFLAKGNGLGEGPAEKDGSTRGAGSHLGSEIHPEQGKDSRAVRQDQRFSKYGPRIPWGTPLGGTFSEVTTLFLTVRHNLPFLCFHICSSGTKATLGETSGARGEGNTVSPHHHEHIPKKKCFQFKKNQKTKKLGWGVAQWWSTSLA